MPPNIGEIMVAEILGTGTLILLGDGVVAGVLLNRSKAQNSGWIVITMAWAFAVFCGVIVAGPISGAHLNPAVTFGLFLDGALPGDQPVLTMLAYWAAEMIGAFIGAVIVFLHYYPHWSQTEDADLKLAVYSTGPAIRNYPWNLVSEIIGTFVLMFVIFMFGVNAAATDNPAGLASLGALPVALLVLVIGLALGGTTGYAINPARDLGPRIAHFLLPIAGKRDSDWAYSWVPVIGPLIGAGVAWVIYNFVVAEYMAQTIMAG
jgi:glycerol uptake facilitator protein